MDATEQRAAMLAGISDRAAIALYDEAMATLEGRGQADFTAALQLRDAAQWTVRIGEMQHALRLQIDAEDPDDRRVVAIIKSIQLAEDARRRILDGLLLTPQRPRGRLPKNPEAAPAQEPPEDDGWDSFGKTVIADGFEDGADGA